VSSLYLVRHGQASLGASNYDQLSNIGREQAQLLGQHLHSLNVRFETVVSGTLSRQVDTAHALLDAYRSANAQAPAVRKDERLNEYDFEPILRTYAFLNGIDAIPLKDPRALYVFLENALSAWVRGDLSSPAIAPWNAFRDRCTQSISAIAAALPRDGRALVVSSGGVVSAVLSEVLGTEPLRFVDLNLAIRNSAITRLDYRAGRLTLMSFNTCPHLEQPSRRHLLTLA
jgi:broad specificity phosphatase PhoE